MACGCSKRTKYKFVWTSADGGSTIEYRTEIEAKAKTLRTGGGSYEKKRLSDG